MESPTLLARLRATGPNSHAAKLARSSSTTRSPAPWASSSNPKLVASQALEAARALAASDAAEAAIKTRAEQVTADLVAEPRALTTILAKPFRDGARAIAQIPVVPRHDVVMKLLDREPVKKLLRAQLVDTLVQFGRRAASPVADNAIARGLGGIGKLVASRPSALGRVASAVSGEVEKQLEKRATDFADTAVASVLENLAEQASDPARAKEQAQMRVALLDGLTELAPKELGAMVQGHEGQLVGSARAALRAWASDASFVADVEAAIAKVIARDAGRALGDVLADVGMRDVVRAQAIVHVERAIARVVGTEAFAKWVEGVVAE